MKTGARQSVRLLLLAGILATGVTAAFAIPPASFGARPTSDLGVQPPSSATAQLMRCLRLDRKNQYSVNTIARSLVLSSTGAVAIWFVIGGIPRRRKTTPIFQMPATSERVMVLDTPRLHARSSDTFEKAFQPEAVTPPPILTSTATVLDLMRESERMEEPVKDAGHIHSAIDAVIERHAVSDDELLAEVQQYARHLLGEDVAVTEHSDVPNGLTEGQHRSVQAEQAVATADDPAQARTTEEMNTVPNRASLSSAPGLNEPAAPFLPIDDEDVLGLAELVQSPTASGSFSPFNELFEAVDTVQQGTSSAVDPYDIIIGEFSPSPEELPEPPLDAQAVAKLIAMPSLERERSPLLDERVIVIGDSDAVIEVEKRILISADARVIGFRRFEDAMKFADERDFDLLLVNGMTEDGWSAAKIYDWLAENRRGWERRAAFALSAPDPASDEFAARTGAWCIVHPFGPKELTSFLCAVIAPPEELAQAN